MGVDTSRPATTVYDPKKGINQPGKDAVQVSVTPNSSATNNPYAVNVSPMANQTKNPYIKPQTPRQPLPPAAQPQQQPPPNPYGSESGPTYVEQRYLDRLNGTDPAFEYVKHRGMEGLANQYSAAGNFNSGAARQGESDFLANIAAQSQAQLDALAGTATAARQNKFNSMVSQFLGSAGGQAGTMGAYDLASASSNDALMNAIVQMMGGKAGVDSQSNQGGINNILGIISSIYGGKKS